MSDSNPDSVPAIGTLRRLAPLFVVQFACWCGMFLMWIGAYPVITTAILRTPPGDAAALRRAMLVLAGCFCWYATLAASLSFAVPAALRRIEPPLLLAITTAIGACGLAGLGLIGSPALLLLCFTALAVGWCGLSNITYTIAGNLLGEQDGDVIDHGYRIFAFSTILPQLAVTLALVFLIGELNAATAQHIMRAAGAAMLLGSGLAVALRAQLAGTPR